MSNKTDLVVFEPKNNLPAVIADDGLQAYLEKIKQFPVLTEEQEINLIRNFKEKGDLQAAQTLIT
jgi:RNA polymerase sigma-32 factor